MGPVVGAFSAPVAVERGAVERGAAVAGVAEGDVLDGRRSTPVSGWLLTIRTLPVLVGLFISMNFSTGHWHLTQPAIAAPASVRQESFATPDDALKAVVDGLKADNLADLLKIFGPAIEPIRLPTKMPASGSSPLLTQTTVSTAWATN